MKNKKTFSLIPYLIQLFKIIAIKLSMDLGLIHHPGDDKYKKDSPMDELLVFLYFHPSEVFTYPQNINVFGKILYFIWIQIAGIMAIVTPVVFFILFIALVKLIQYSILIFCSTILTIVFLFVKIFKTITTIQINKNKILIINNHV